MKVAFAFASGLALASATAIPSFDVAFNSSVATGPFVQLLQNVIEEAKTAVKKVTTKKISTVADFEGWDTFKANGVNLGGWLLQEKGIDPAFFNDNGASEAVDEDSFCQILGKKRCGRLLEERYASYFTTQDIDKFAEYGVNTLRIPVGYWTFMPALSDVHYHTGGQKSYLSKLASYAIGTHGMHVILDLHALPGNQNGLDNAGKVDQLEWWHNETNYDHTLKLVELATEYILDQPYSNQWTLLLINEPLPALYYFGQTDESFAYLNQYYNDSLSIVRKKAPALPVMLSDGFAGPQTWDQWWANSTQNIVFDTHIYFFQSGGGYSFDAAYSGCYLAQSYQAATNPVFIGEWSIQAAGFNTINGTAREQLFRSQFSAYTTFLNGGAFWNGKHNGTNVVGDDNSTQPYYWSWEVLADEGIVPKKGETVQTYC
ncbi:glycoside hydrolase superfamily [Xylariaceae sp. FL0804]|nr:glycoside hydrolase superfamily [Xylariaceae sp. FL0804]